MRGQTGIGALIVFIAFVLTAAIAAFVTTQTTIATQSKAAAVADQARERTGTTFEVIRVEGIANVSANTIHKYLVWVRLAPGSSSVNMNSTVLAYYVKDGREMFKYCGTIDNESALPAVSNGCYYILSRYSYCKGGLCDNIFEPGELYVIGVTTNYTIGPSDWWRFSLIPKEGQPMEIYGVAPDIFTSETVILR